MNLFHAAAWGKGGRPVQTSASAAGPGGGGCCGKQHPALVKRLGTAEVVHGAVALGKTLLGMGLADAAERDRRRARCADCEFSRAPCPVAWVAELSPEPGAAALGCCGECRCYLWAKTARADEHCPRGKW